METWHLHIKGQVQGVGFRPWVFRLAKAQNLKGWIKNTSDGVHIEINATQDLAHTFLNILLEAPPPLSVITSHQLYPSQKQVFHDFTIRESQEGADVNVLLTPDFGICNDCRSELEKPDNRRHQYPFTTCTNCGPRFSIIHSLPYDRAQTSMERFDMCPTCKGEYSEPRNRRYYSQTNSCPACSIQVQLYDNNQRLLSQSTAEIMANIIQFWEAGKIVAIKGIGGYLLTCDASNALAIKRLRERKYRPKKPFAVMLPNLKRVKEIVELTSHEAEVLNATVMPILLLSLNKEATTTLAIEDISPQLNQLGVMLPYTPFFDLLLRSGRNAFGKPIVATSGNISNAPILFEDEKAINELGEIADFIVTNNRKIVTPQDDSVIKHSYFKKQKIIIRRSRGLAPTYINAELTLPANTLLGMGAMMKSSFAYLHQNNMYISQYLGDLMHFDTQENYRNTIQHFLNLFQKQADVILCDAHPDYPSTHLAKAMAKELSIPCFTVQHHVAHFAAVLGEHNLLRSARPILGVIWDGTGLGSDGQIWGGEFFVFEQSQFKRYCHLQYFNYFLSDKMAKEPRLSAFALTYNIPASHKILKEKFTEREWKIYDQLIVKKDALQSSSMGRLFDAVASLLGLCDVQTFEGEAAMQLESIAFDFCQKQGLDISEYYEMGVKKGKISTSSLMNALLVDLEEGKEKSFIAAKFHYSLVKLIDAVAQSANTYKLAFSGGVFQNGVLVDLIIHHLGENYELFFHDQLSPNDENIAFGQLIYYQITQDSSK